MKKIIKSFVKNLSKLIFAILNLTKAGRYFSENFVKFNFNKKQTIKHNNINLSFYSPNRLNHFRIETFSTKEPETLEWINKFSEKSVFWDIGANIGLYTCYAAKLKNCKVYAFEPSIFNLEWLGRNIQLNDLVEKIVVISPLGFWKEDVPIQDIFIMNEEEQINSIWHDKNHSSVQYLFPDKESEIEKSNRIAEQQNDFIGAAKFLWPIPDRGLNRRIYRIKNPVLLVWGEYDGIISPVYADEFSNRLKKCKKVILSNSGHLPMLDQPKILSKYVLDFFNES